MENLMPQTTLYQEIEAVQLVDLQVSRLKLKKKS
jgi:hypothetical protein